MVAVVEIESKILDQEAQAFDVTFRGGQAELFLRCEMG